MDAIASRRHAARDVAALVLSLACCYAVAGLGGYWTSLGLGPWYDGLRKPSWTPPGGVIGPVWTVLYAMMAVAAWLVWRRRGPIMAKLPLSLHALQLALNLIWPGLFFGIRRPDLAFAEILILWVAILATLLAFARVSRTAGFLLVPYLAWVTFASTLNLALWRLNARGG